MTTVTAPVTDASQVPSGPSGPLGRALVGLIRFYRMAISPLRPPSCRFTPTCSEYALVAIQRYGPARGSWLALRRLLRCHPFHRGGHDPVPPRVGRDGPGAPDAVTAPTRPRAAGEE